MRLRGQNKICFIIFICIINKGFFFFVCALRRDTVCIRILEKVYCFSFEVNERKSVVLSIPICACGAFLVKDQVNFYEGFIRMFTHFKIYSIQYFLNKIYRKLLIFFNNLWVFSQDLWRSKRKSAYRATRRGAAK